MNLEQRLERMYQKVSRGRLNGPDRDAMPRVIGTIMVNDIERRVYESRPAVWNCDGVGVHLPPSFAVKPDLPAPVGEFWQEID